ncbi:hypothetical protein HDU84_002440 [Entophlyctis sp. JEL0112]|nr:hypothetical protein HDU84_002440 [Entophlyctis sp. JEL0112]
MKSISCLLAVTFANPYIYYYCLLMLLQFVDRVFALAAPNLCINGMPFTDEMLCKPMEQDMEPFDEQLRAMREGLMQAAAEVRVRVAGLRVGVPTTVASETRRVLRSITAECDGEADAADEIVSHVGDAGIKRAADWFSLQADELHEDEKTSKFLLDNLQKDVPQLVEKWKRARVVINDICTDPNNTGETQKAQQKGVHLLERVTAVELTPRKTRSALLKMIR